MFSALSQGSPIYLLDKTSTPDFKIGEVVGVSYPKVNPYSVGVQNTVDLKVKIEGEVQEFNSIPSINSVVSYNGGKVIISESKQGIQTEVENNVKDCEEILKQINPQFAIDKERDERLTSLENRFDGFESKLDKIFNLIQK